MISSGRGMILTGFAVSGVFWGAFAAWLPALQRGAGVSDGELGVALGGLAVAALPVMPAVGRLADRRGAVEALQLALIASAVTLPWPASAGGFPSLLVSFLVLGATTGALDVALNAAAAEWEAAASGERRLMSLAHAVMSFGVVAGSLAAGLGRELGMPLLPMMLLIAGATAAASTNVPLQGRPPAPRTSSAADRERRSPVLLAFGALVAASFVVEDGLQSWSPLYLETAVDARPAVSALGLTLFAGAMGVGRLAGHVLVARWGESRLLTSAGLLCAVGVALLVGAPSAAPALVGLALAGAGTSVLVPVLLTAAGRRADPGRRGEDLALINGLGYAGFIFGPLLVGVVSALSSMTAAFGVLGVVGLLVAVAAPRLLRVRTPDDEGPVGDRSARPRTRTRGSRSR